MSAKLEDRQCPYCGCTFTPAEPDQVYCAEWCREQAELEGATGSRD
jgi:predicted nucleic acid-binding Zn ribbon protein